MSNETIEQARKRLETTVDGRNGFYRGVLWVQRWISVEEELPHTDETGLSDNVVLQLKVYGKKEKNEYQCCIEAYYDSDTKMWCFMLPVDKRNLTLTPLAWRPIERA